MQATPTQSGVFYARLGATLCKVSRSFPSRCPPSRRSAPRHFHAASLSLLRPFFLRPSSCCLSSSPCPVAYSFRLCDHVHVHAPGVPESVYFANTYSRPRVFAVRLRGIIGDCANSCTRRPAGFHVASKMKYRLIWLNLTFRRTVFGFLEIFG